jgi:hypothetical protein
MSRKEKGSDVHDDETTNRSRSDLAAGGTVGPSVWHKRSQVRASVPATASAARAGQQDGLLAAYGNLEKALRDGDAKLWLSLQSREGWSRVTDAQKTAILAHFRCDPANKFVLLAAGDGRGVVIHRIDGSDNYSAK